MQFALLKQRRRGRFSFASLPETQRRPDDAMSFYDTRWQSCRRTSTSTRSSLRNFNSNAKAARLRHRPHRPSERSTSRRDKDDILPNLAIHRHPIRASSPKNYSNFICEECPSKAMPHLRVPTRRCSTTANEISDAISNPMNAGIDLDEVHDSYFSSVNTF